MLEMLPDEMLLEICRYLHCGHVLFSFFGLNSRLNQTITIYCRQVSLRRLTYEQFLHIYSHILPQIGTTIISLTINKLQQFSFSSSFGHHMHEIFPNLEIFAFDDWKHDEFFSFVGHRLSQLKHLRTIIIRGLRRTVTDLQNLNSINDRLSMVQMLQANPQLTRICFEPDCYSLRLLSNKEDQTIQSGIVELNISLDALESLAFLPTLFPNLRRLNAIVEDFPSINQNIPLFQCLTDFSLDAIHSPLSLENIVLILRLMPSIERLSLTLMTCDSRLIDGKQVFALLPSRFNDSNLTESFKYAVCFHALGDYNLDVTTLLESWKPIPIAYAINKEVHKTYILVHTIPYASVLLSLRSKFANKFGNNTNDGVYRGVQYVCLSHASTLLETFAILRHCRQVQDLTIQIDNKKETPSIPVDKQILPRLGRLELISIFGTVFEWHHLKTLVLAAHKLSTLCIDLQCILSLFANNADDVMLPRVMHLFIDGQRNDGKLTAEHIHRLIKVFSGLRSLKIKYKTCDMIDLNIMAAVLDNFEHLIVFTINGKMPNETSTENIRTSIIEHSSRLSSIERPFKAECIDDWFQVWM